MRILAGHFALVCDGPAVDGVGKHLADMLAAPHASGPAGLDLGLAGRRCDLLHGQPGRHGLEAKAAQVEPRSMPHHLGLGGLDHQPPALALLDMVDAIAVGGTTVEPEALVGAAGHATVHILCQAVAVQLVHQGRQAAKRLPGLRVYGLGLGQRDYLDAALIFQGVQSFERGALVAAQAIELPEKAPVDPFVPQVPGLRCFEHCPVLGAVFAPA